MSRKVKLLIAFPLLLIVVAAASAWYFQTALERLSAFVPDKLEVYSLREGMVERQVVSDLAGRDFMPVVISLWVKLHPEFRGIQKGDYHIDGQRTLPEILGLMVRGDVIKERFPQLVIPEGMALPRVRERLLGMKGVSEARLAALDKPREFMERVLKKDGLLEAIGGAHDSLEGLLMPATYPLPKAETDPLRPLRQALYEMADFMAISWPQRDEGLPLEGPYEALILASLVERETPVAEELPEIAGVFYNRLQKKMRLQTDPAVMYGVSPTFRGPLLRSHLRADTPYNTYTREGLTPTPICMPGRKAILAVLHPNSTEALYFVAKGPNPLEGHAFSKTNEEHVRAAKAYRQRVKEAREAKQREQEGKDQQDSKAEAEENDLLDAEEELKGKERPRDSKPTGKQDGKATGKRDGKPAGKQG
ncbi:MAG: endolytic transglycosylase MltG [Succinivibrionaceae bacterium]|nr:endolytic transglycosylase MltG [Succinivibrionaceae bacterium]